MPACTRHSSHSVCACGVVVVVVVRCPECLRCIARPPTHTRTHTPRPPPPIATTPPLSPPRPTHRWLEHAMNDGHCRLGAPVSFSSAASSSSTTTTLLFNCCMRFMPARGTRHAAAGGGGGGRPACPARIPAAVRPSALCVSIPRQGPHRFFVCVPVTNPLVRFFIVNQPPPPSPVPSLAAAAAALATAGGERGAFCASSSSSSCPSSRPHVHAT